MLDRCGKLDFFLCGHNLKNFDKVVVFWDGENSSSARKIIYPQYKENRTFTKIDFKEESFSQQKHRVKQYLEEITQVRQENLDLQQQLFQISRNTTNTQ